MGSTTRLRAASAMPRRSIRAISLQRSGPLPTPPLALSSLLQSQSFRLSSSEESDYADGIILPFIFDVVTDANGNVRTIPPQNPPYYPVWQISPPPKNHSVLKASSASVLDVLAIDAIDTLTTTREAIFGETTTMPGLLARVASNAEDHAAFHARLVPSDTAYPYAQPHGLFFSACLS